MNNNDISNLMNMLSNMDQSQISEGVSKLNSILSEEDKKKIMQMLNNKK